MTTQQLAKLSPPRVALAYPRRRLFKRLDGLKRALTPLIFILRMRQA